MIHNNTIIVAELIFYIMEISKITIKGQVYDLCDQTARDKVQILSQEEYDALDPKSENVLYAIK